MGNAKDAIDNPRPAAVVIDCLTDTITMFLILNIRTDIELYFYVDRIM